MADVRANYALERKKLAVQIGQQQQNRLATELRVMQLEADLEQANTTLEAIDAHTAELQSQLDTLTED